MDNQNDDKLRSSSGDYSHAIAKAGISAIPVIGGPASELFSAIIVPPLSKRRDKWIREIAEGLKRLEEKVEGFKIENLSQNEMFITTVMHASQAAIRNHQSEKLEALRNAVLNAALPNPPEEDIQLIFLNFVDTLASWHLRLLKLFDNPLEWGERHGVTFQDLLSGGRSIILENAFAELRGRRDFYDQLFKDLFYRGLVNKDSNWGTTMTGRGLFESCTTNLGKKFIKFITSPLN